MATMNKLQLIQARSRDISSGLLKDGASALSKEIEWNYGDYTGSAALNME